MRSLPEERGTVKRYGGVGIAVAVLTIAFGYLVAPFNVPGEDSLAARLVYTLRWQIFPIMTLVFAIERVSTTRLQTTAIDPMRGTGEHLIEFQQRFLRNTLEQLIIHFSGQLVLCTFLTSDSIRIIPPISLLFMAGRIVFWIGYKSGDPLKRATGFSMNFLPSIVTVCYCTFCITWSGYTYLITGQ